MLKDGKAESLCNVIRDLPAYRQARSWNGYDNGLLKRLEKLLSWEGSFSVSVPTLNARTNKNAPRGRIGKRYLDLRLY